jgi:glutaredoxin 3
MSMLNHAESYKPFKYPWAIELAVESDKIFWGEWEAELQEDVNQWKQNEILEEEKEHITQILRLFTQTDCQVASNYCDLFLPRFKNHEIRQMLMSFASREAIHQRAYALLNDTLGMHESEYKAFLKYEEMLSKIEFMQDNDVKTKKGLGLSLAQSVCNEGMGLFSAFVMLLNYQRFGKMKGMCKIVEWSIRDETIHVNGMSKLFLEFCKEHPRVVTDELKGQIYTMFTKAVELEDSVIDLAYTLGAVEGLGADEVKQYIRYIANRRLNQIGFKAIWDIKDNPLPWLDWVLNGASHTNFFEQRVSDYSASNMSGDWGW